MNALGRTLKEDPGKGKLHRLDNVKVDGYPAVHLHSDRSEPGFEYDSFSFETGQLLVGVDITTSFKDSPAQRRRLIVAVLGSVSVTGG